MGIPAAFVVRFMVLRNCSPHSMGRTRPTWHQVAHLSRRVLAQNRAGPITWSIICHDYPERLSVSLTAFWLPFTSAAAAAAPPFEINPWSCDGLEGCHADHLSPRVAGRRRTGNLTYCKGGRICLTFRLFNYRVWRTTWHIWNVCNRHAIPTISHSRDPSNYFRFRRYFKLNWALTNYIILPLDSRIPQIFL